MTKLYKFFSFGIIFSLLAGCGIVPDSTLWGEPITATPYPTVARLTTVPESTPIIPSTLTTTPTQWATGTPYASLPGDGLEEGTSSAPLATLPPINRDGPMDTYFSQSGDTLEILSKRFQIPYSFFQSTLVLPAPGVLLPTGTLLLIPRPDTPIERTPSDFILPDTEVVYGPSTLDFNTDSYVASKNGYLKTYREYIISGGWLTGSQAVERIAQENSLSPRIILAVIEYESHWVLGTPQKITDEEYPLGHRDYLYRRLFRQLMWASGEISKGYYLWRSGDLHELTFDDGSKLRINPLLNAGTVAIQYYLAQTHTREEWDAAVSSDGFYKLYVDMFGNPSNRAANYEPTIPPGLTQPMFTFPFEKNKTWAYISGPHSAWEKEGAMAALDLAPSADEPGCIKTDAWVVAPAAGKVVRTGKGVVMLDLDGDGVEQTGWVLLFLHIASEGMVKDGAILKPDDRIGHPSCEGGVSTGTHLHIARKFNGEWILADGPIPFNMDGWVAHNGVTPYKGTLTRGDEVITSCSCSDFNTNITRE